MVLVCVTSLSDQHMHHRSYMGVDTVNQFKCSNNIHGTTTELELHVSLEVLSTLNLLQCLFTSFQFDVQVTVHRHEFL